MLRFSWLLASAHAVPLVPHTLIGECCQMNDRMYALQKGGGAKGGGAAVPAAPTQWWLVCMRCAPDRGLKGVIEGVWKPFDRARPPYCDNQSDGSAPDPEHPVADVLQRCQHCNRWLCDVCRYPSPPWSCHECPVLRLDRGEIEIEAPSMIDPTRKVIM